MIRLSPLLRSIGWPALLCVCWPALAQAQGRNANWVGPDQYWISFTSGTAVLTQLPLNPGACAAISDTNGILRVYARFHGFWDGEEHASIANNPTVTGMNPFPGWGAGLGSQEAVFVPKPGDPERAFYIARMGSVFAVENYQRMGIIELKLGVSGVEPPAVVDTGFTWFMDNAMAKRMVVPHANGMDYWFVASPIGQGLYHAYRITSAGIDTPPVISAAGPALPADWGRGQMVPSFQGDRFAAVSLKDALDTTTVGYLYIHGFDRSTGAVQEGFALPDLHIITGVEFSRSGRYLYVAEVNDSGSVSVPKRRDLYQYDLEAADVHGSRVLLNTYTSTGPYGHTAHTLAMGPDGRIYMANLLGDTLSVIRSPDLPGTLCDFVGNALCCGTFFTLPAPAKWYHDDPGTALGIAQVATTGITVYPNPAHDRAWVTGLPDQARHYLLRDATGRVVHQAGSPQNGIDLGTVAAGPYVLEILARHGERVATARIMKQ